MPKQIAATYRFYSWLRQGLLAGLSGPGGSSPATAGRLALPIRLRVNDRAPIDVNVQLYGPGDITGLDAREIIRTEPHAHMTDFEPNYFPAIEFDRPDFPWLFTPATADSARRLRPWICLIVVPQDRATLKTNQQRPLPAITCAVEDLPDLDQSWAWPTPRSWRNNARRPILLRGPRCNRFSTTTPNARSRGCWLRDASIPIPPTMPASCPPTTWGGKPVSASRSSLKMNRP